MSNIHSLRDYRASGSAPPPRSSNTAGISGRQIATLGSSSSSSNLGQSSAPYNAYEPGKLGISLIQPPPHADGTTPDLLERFFPRATIYSVTAVITIIDLIMFLATLIVGGVEFDGAFVSDNKMIGPNAYTLYTMGGSWEPAIRAGAVWRLLIPIILHAGIIHILGNLLFQTRMGFTLEIRWERWKFVAMYVLAGISSSLWSAVLDSTYVSVGASGAIFGIVGADMTYLAYNFIEIPDGRMEAIFLVFATIINFLIGLSPGSGVDNYAHLGGLITGWFLGIWIPPHLVKRDNETMYRVGAAIGFWGLFILFCSLLWGGNPWSCGYDYCRDPESATCNACY